MGVGLGRLDSGDYFSTFTDGKGKARERVGFWDSR